MTKEVGDITEKMGDEVKDGIEDAIREVGHAVDKALKARKLSGNIY